jgi:RecA-family ATPase
VTQEYVTRNGPGCKSEADQAAKRAAAHAKRDAMFERMRTVKPSPEDVKELIVHMAKWDLCNFDDDDDSDLDEIEFARIMHDHHGMYAATAIAMWREAYGFREADASPPPPPPQPNGHDTEAKTKEGEGEPQPLPKLKTVTAATLLQKPAPPREWLCREWIPAHDVTLVGGDGGIGKSILMLQLHWACASARQWLGMDVRQCPSLYVTCEDPQSEVHYRLEQFQKAECTATGFDNFHIFDGTLHKHPLLAALDEDRLLVETSFFRQIEEKVTDIGAGLVTFDASADVFGGNEIDRIQVRSFVSQLRRLSLRRKCASILIIHPSVDAMKTGRGYSGSTGWNNSARSRLYFSTATKEDGQEVDQDLRKLELAKSNRAKPGATKLLRWDEGRFAPESRAFDDLAQQADDENLFMQLLDQYDREGRKACVTTGYSYAPKEFADHPDGKGVSVQRFKNAMNKLLSMGKIRNEETGPKSRRVSKLVRVTIQEAVSNNVAQIG